MKENFIKKFNYKNISEDILCLKKNKKLILALGHHVPMSSTEQNQVYGLINIQQNFFYKIV